MPETPATRWCFALSVPPPFDADVALATLGAKGAGLAMMANELATPVPDGFVVSAAACEAYLRSGWPDGLDDELRASIERLEAATGKGLGDRDKPLLVSVRASAPVSMPGMLPGILDLGLDDETTTGLAEYTRDGVFATAHRQRLERTWRACTELAEVPDDAWVQLRIAIEAVFRSWQSDRARAYREKESIPDATGTAVVVQSMVFADLGEDSASGVLFTRDPATGEDRRIGDVRFGAHGKQDPASTHPVDPVSVIAERLPDVADELERHARALERHYADLCDIEFTIEEGRLWLLQARVGRRGAQADLRIALEMAADEAFPLSREEAIARVSTILADPPMVVTADRDVQAPIVATGSPASPGLAIGSIATSSAAALEMMSAGRDVILVSTETSTEDVRAIARATGILTTRGGLASHAAVVARGWHIPAVVGAGDVQVDGRRVSVGARLWREGDEISIDGSTGDVFGEAIEVRATVVPEASTLLGWAAQQGVTVGAPEARAVPEGAPSADAPPARDGDLELQRVLLVKGHSDAAGIAAGSGMAHEVVTARLASLAADGKVRESGELFALTAAGRDAAMTDVDVEKAALGGRQTLELLETFRELDERCRAVMTTWRMREIDGARILNDHTDAVYDGGILADLATTHADARAFLAPLVALSPRLGRYVDRLDAAAASAARGDHLFVASTRVDSYHVVWRDLLQDLTLLSGAGRDAIAVAEGQRPA